MAADPAIKAIEKHVGHGRFRDADIAYATHLIEVVDRARREAGWYIGPAAGDLDVVLRALGGEPRVMEGTTWWTFPIPLIDPREL